MNTTRALRIPDYLDHILQAISRIKNYTHDMTAATFLHDEKTQDAVIRNIEIIGEAARNIERNHPDFANQHAGVPWGTAYEMRNVLAHGYFKVDFEIVWKTIEKDLPELEKKILAIRTQV